MDVDKMTGKVTITEGDRKVLEMDADDYLNMESKPIINRFDPKDDVNICDYCKSFGTCTDYEFPCVKCEHNANAN